MKKLWLIVILALLPAALPADTLGYFSFGFVHDGVRRESHTFLFVDHHARLAVIILDTNNDWWFDQEEVTIVELTAETGGTQGDATYRSPGIQIVVDGNDATMRIQGITIMFRSTQMIPLRQRQQ